MSVWRWGLLSAALATLFVGCSPPNSPTEESAAGASGSGDHAPPPSAGAGGTSLGDPAECARDGDGRTTLVFVNGCDAEVTFRGSDLQGGTLAPSASRCVDVGSDVETLPSKRYWGFTGEDPGPEHHTLAELTFNTDFQDFDWYNISHVDAFNLPMQLEPLARPDCKVLTCAADLLAGCPAPGRFLDSRGQLVACVSPERDDPMSVVARYFESCDDAYAWSGDDQQGDDPSPVRACAGEDWQVRFCPKAP